MCVVVVTVLEGPLGRISTVVLFGANICDQRIGSAMLTITQSKTMIDKPSSPFLALHMDKEK